MKRVWHPVWLAAAVCVVGAVGVFADVSSDEGYLGVVVPHNRVDVAAEIAGKVQDVLVDLGDSVQAGQLLVSMTVQGLDRDIERAAAALAAEKSTAERVQLEIQNLSRQLERRRNTDEGVFAAEAVEKLESEKRIKESELEQARARTRQREAELGALRDQKRALQIRAPFAGTVVQRYESPGAYVQPGRQLVRVTSSEQPFIRFAVPAAESSWLQPGAMVLARDDRQPEIVRSARVQRVSPEVDSATNMIFAEAAFAVEEGDATLATGTVVRVFRDEAARP